MYDTLTPIKFSKSLSSSFLRSVTAGLERNRHLVKLETLKKTIADLDLEVSVSAENVE